VDTPAGSVVIGGDAVNDVLAPPQECSTSDQVEGLAKGADSSQSPSVAVQRERSENWNK
jgi:hypothetical protein